MLKMFVGLLATTCLSVIGFANEEPIPQPVIEVSQKAPINPFTGKVTGNKVRMRTQPSLDGHVVKETGFGELFIVTDERDGFYAVTPPQGTKGYVFRTFVLEGIVEGAHVNVRLYPDTEAPVVAQLNTGDRIQTKVCDINNKWLELDLPTTTHFYLAKEFVDNIGPVEMLAQVQARHHEATHKLNAASLYAQSEIQKPLPQIDLEGVASKFAQVIATYKDLPEIVSTAEEAGHLINEVYIQKKVAFLENKGDQTSCIYTLNPAHVERLAQLGIALKATQSSMSDANTVTAAITDKMLIWEPLEHSLHHLWAAAHGNHSLDEFYAEECDNAITLAGIVESYNRPVKNLPGDYLLRIDNHPVAFLYSTRINLQQFVGKQITVVGSPRPNNHFAFPAYFVLSVE